MSQEPKKKNFIRYTPEQLAAVPSPAQLENQQQTDPAVRAVGTGALVGGVAGMLLGVPGAGAVIGGTVGAVNHATRKKE